MRQSVWIAAQFSSRWRWNKCPPAVRRREVPVDTGLVHVKDVGREDSRPKNRDTSSNCLVRLDGRRKSWWSSPILAFESGTAPRWLVTRKKENSYNWEKLSNVKFSTPSADWCPKWAISVCNSDAIFLFLQITRRLQLAASLAKAKKQIKTPQEKKSAGIQVRSKYGFVPSSAQEWGHGVAA